MNDETNPTYQAARPLEALVRPKHRGHIMQWFGSSLAPFMGGVVVAINLTQLIPTNIEYEASWWKVAVAVGLSLICSLLYKPGNGA